MQFFSDAHRNATTPLNMNLPSPSSEAAFIPPCHPHPPMIQLFLLFLMLSIPSLQDLAAGVLVATTVLIELVGLNPVQSPESVLHRLYAHCESEVQPALKFPQRIISIALLAQHSAPLAHGVLSGLQFAPSGRYTIAAVPVAAGALVVDEAIGAR